MKKFGSSAISRILIVVAGAAFGGAVVATATALTTTSLPSFHQGAPIDISPAPDQYHPTVPQAPEPAPVRLLIPSLGISAPVERLGVTRDYALQAPAGVADVGWYRLGASPGFAGDAIISGHRGYPGGIPAVFNRINRMQAGDEVDVRRADGTAARFTVTRVYTIPERSVPAGFFATDGAPRLTLVTCAGDFRAQDLTYSDRLVVEATPVANSEGEI